ncbi:hypothetical protein GX48_06227 [Paracoccidioides brasiliensis]|nr:hypothetical protein GX48_06227 [Paracoccidioides brasiliensis]
MSKLIVTISFLAVWPLQGFAGALYPLALEPGKVRVERDQKLHGRFLHITDIHLDTYYKPHSNPDDDHECHRGPGNAGYFGTTGSSCDSPLALVDATFAWIQENVADSIDFVVWTGDSARHDNDEKAPRTEKEVIDMNQVLADKFFDIFSKSSGKENGMRIPVVPTIGNNDIMPHNIFKSGPNRWTRKLGMIWDPFIPEEQRHTFVEGGWFYVEVIPDKLAVFSLNTLYFYDSNSAADGCEDKNEPGYKHMEWLRVQLQFIRKRNMKAILIGHVPPARTDSKENWDETCWQKYTLWLYQYRDIIVGNMFGHMNIDHFMFQDSKELKFGYDGVESHHKQGKQQGAEEKVSVQSRLAYLSSLRRDWSQLPYPPEPSPSSFVFINDSHHNDDIHLLDSSSSRKKKRMGEYLNEIGGPWAERYSVSLVSPSIIPNYYPALRVIEYNTSGLENASLWSEVSGQHNKPSFRTSTLSEDLDFEGQNLSAKKKKGSKKKKKKKKKPTFKVPHPPSPTAPPGPAYSNQPFTLLSYTQYFSNLSDIDTKTMVSTANQYSDNQNPLHWIRGRGRKPDRYEPRSISFEVLYDTKTDRSYKLKDLTVRSYLDLARRVAQKDSEKKDQPLVLPNADARCQQRKAETPDGPSGPPLDAGGDKSDPLCTQIELPLSAGTKSRESIWAVFVRRAFVGYFDSDVMQ